MLIEQNKAIALLTAGDVIACPTEAVYGLSCDATNSRAVKKVIALKERSSAKGFIVIVSDFDMLDELINPLDAERRALLEEKWPGPVTFLMPIQKHLSPLLNGEFETQAIRMSSHPVLADLVKAFGKPIVSTSANVSGFTPARSVSECEKYFGDDLPVLSGDLGTLKKPTSIIDLLTMDKIR